MNAPSDCGRADEIDRGVFRLMLTIVVDQYGTVADAEVLPDGVTPRRPDPGPVLARGGTREQLKRVAQCLLMDRLGIENGTKAIDRALHEHWSEDLQAEFGRPNRPATIKKWRSERRAAARLAAALRAERQPEMGAAAANHMEKVR